MSATIIQLNTKKFQLQETAELSQRIFALLSGMANAESQSDTAIHWEFYKQYLSIQKDVQNNRTIKFLLPAFPAKSANRNKTEGSLPDLAEYLGLQRLDNLARSISVFYEPGAEVLLCSDGRVFSDLVGVDDRDVSLYGEALKEMIEEFAFKYLRIFNLEDFFHEQDFEAMRHRLDEEFAEPIEDIKLGVRTNEEERLMFNGIHRFLLDDYLFIDSDNSKNKIRKYTKDLAYKVIQRSHSWSGLVAQEFPDFIRLSIHPQVSGSAKFPVQLVKSLDRWRTPWHSVAIFDGESFALGKRADALANGAKLKKFANKYEYYSLV